MTDDLADPRTTLTSSAIAALSTGAGVAPTDGRPVALVGSSGGHLSHLIALAARMPGRPRFWVTFETPDAVDRLAGERVYWCHHPTNRNLKNLARNTVLAWRILRRERPAAIVSSGAAVAIPFAYLGRILGIPFIFLEVIDRVSSATLTGRAVAPIAAAVLVQWPAQQRLYRRSILVGRVL